MRRGTTYGAGTVNIWLNMAKLLIGLVIAYQQVLTEQLKISVLDLDVEVLTVESTVSKKQRVRLATDPFFIPFVPASRDKYSTGQLTIERIEFIPVQNGQPNKVFVAGEPRVSKSFQWPAGPVGSGAILAKEFSLREVLPSPVADGSKTSPELDRGRYSVFYSVVLEGELGKKRWPADFDPSKGGDCGKAVNCLLVDYVTDVPSQFVEIKRGQTCDLPPDLAGLSEQELGKLSNKRGSGIAIRVDKDGKPLLKDGKEQQVADAILIARPGAYGRRATGFKAGCVQVEADRNENLYAIQLLGAPGGDRVVLFELKENSRPESRLELKAKQRLGVYYDGDFLKATDGKWYFPISRYVADPDSESVEVTEISGPGAGYYDKRQMGKEWAVVRKDEQKRSYDDITVTVRDECSSLPVPIRVIWRKK
jgi:hypothetical protein